MIILEVASKKIFNTRIARWRILIAPPLARFLMNFYLINVFLLTLCGEDQNKTKSFSQNSLTGLTKYIYLIEHIAQLKEQKLNTMERVLILTRSDNFPAPDVEVKVLDKFKKRVGIKYTVWKQNWRIVLDRGIFVLWTTNSNWNWSISHAKFCLV